jgi:acyl-CoA thioesterase-1
MISAPPHILLLVGSMSYGLRRAARNLAMLLMLVALLPAGALLAGLGRADTPVRIVAIGDSLTAGHGLKARDGLVPQLQRWLEARGAADIAVINMGVSGDTTAGGRARIGWALAEGADAVILELGANDMLRGIDPAESRANLEAILADLAARGLPVLLSGMRSAENFGPEYKTAFDAIYPDLAAEFDALFDPFFLEGLTGQPALFQDDGLHPNSAGIARVVERLGPLVLELAARVER